MSMSITEMLQSQARTLRLAAEILAERGEDPAIILRLREVRLELLDEEAWFWAVRAQAEERAERAGDL